MRRIFSLVIAGLCFVHMAKAADINGISAILDTTPNFNGGAGPGLLTDGVIGGDDWLNVPVFQYLGWQDAGYVPVDSGSDSAVSQPQITFDLGGMFMLDSVTIHYNVDYPPGTAFANIRAPDELGVSFSITGTGGPFGGGLIETGFDDGPEGGAGPGEGSARVLTMDLGGTTADAVRMNFMNDGEWTFLSEVSFQGAMVPEPTTFALFGLGMAGLLFLKRRRRS